MLTAATCANLCFRWTDTRASDNSRQKESPQMGARNFAISNQTARLAARPNDKTRLRRGNVNVSYIHEITGFSEPVKRRIFRGLVRRSGNPASANRSRSEPQASGSQEGAGRPEVEAEAETGEPNRFFSLEPWQEAFVRTLPRFCECTNDFELGTRIKERDLALNAAHIQVNTPMVRRYIVADVDRSDAAEAHVKAGVAQLNIIAINPVNGHAHAFWELATPVTYFARSRWASIQYCSEVQRGLFRRLGADFSYNDGLPKNPISDWWDVRHVHDRAYSLRDLAATLTSKDMRSWQKGERETGMGRNVILFNELRYTSYGRVVSCQRRRRLFGFRDGSLCHSAKPQQFPRFCYFASCVRGSFHRKIGAQMDLGALGVLSRPNSRKRTAVSRASECARQEARGANVAGHTSAAKRLPLSASPFAPIGVGLRRGRSKDE